MVSENAGSAMNEKPPILKNTLWRFNFYLMIRRNEIFFCINLTYELKIRKHSSQGVDVRSIKLHIHSQANSNDQENGWPD